MKKSVLPSPLVSAGKVFHPEAPNPKGSVNGDVVKVPSPLLMNANAEVVPLPAARRSVLPSPLKSPANKAKLVNENAVPKVNGTVVKVPSPLLRNVQPKLTLSLRPAIAKSI